MEFEEYNDDLTSVDLFPEGKIARISYDCTVRKFKLICKHYDLLQDIQKSFRAPNSGAFFASRYGYRQEEYLYAINKFGYFDVGLLFDVLLWFKTNFNDLSVVAISQQCKQYIDDYLTPLKASLKSLGSIQISNISEDLGRNNELKRNGQQPYEFRDYQKSSVEYLITKGYGKGLIEIPTAGGKSFILANFIWNIHKLFDSHYRYLILVPNKQLVEQFYKDLIDYGMMPEKLTRFTAGMKGKNAFNPEAMVVIANRQYVFSNKQKLPKIDVLICDEAHQCTAQASSEFIESLNCKIKVGCSGTLPRDKWQKWKLVGMFSRIVYQEDITTLQKQGYISKLKITLLKVKDEAVEADKNLLFNVNSNIRYHSDEFGNSNIMFNDAYNAEHDYFAKHYKELYAPIFQHLLTLSKNTLILFDRIEIGRNLFEYAKELYAGKKDVFYIDGSIAIEEREKIRAEFEKKDGNLLLAQSATFAVGINIKRLENLVFLVSSKAFSRTIQSIGRTLRLHESKTEAHLFDCSWNLKYSQKHLKERLAIYKQMYQKTPDEIINFTIK